MPAPTPAGAGSAGLRGVSLRASNDAWAVGFSQPPDLTSEAELVEHWNGRRWRVVPTPALGPVAELDAVTTISPADAWAVGSRTPPAGSGIVPLAMRWDGSAWTSVDIPAPPSGDGALDAVASTSSSDVWAVGDSISGSKDGTLIEHFDGSSWTVVPAPSPSAIVNELNGVAAVSSARVWAAGAYYNHGLHLLVEGWDGTSWRVAFEGDLGSLSGVSSLPGGLSMAVGQSGNGTAVTPVVAFTC